MTSRAISELLYGHDATERIVAAEFNRQNQIELFIRSQEGNVDSVRVPHRPWLITDEQGKGIERAENAITLEGHLPLRYRIEFANWNAFRESLDRLNASNAQVHRFNHPVDQ